MKTKEILILFLPILFLMNCNKEEKITCGAKKNHGLPIISINLEKPIWEMSKESYIKGEIEIIDRAPVDIFSSATKIRGRGNTTWDFPKKPFQIKFNEKEPVLGMAKGKRWILLANYTDKTMLRNEVGFDLSRQSNLDWTPDSRFVELYIDDEFMGTYQITQKVEEASNRVDIGDDGFLLEVEGVARLNSDDIYFGTEFNFFNIKEPEIEFESSEFYYIQNFLKTVENILFSADFNDSVDGYSKYIDLNSLVDWYLVNEITKNNDAAFITSVFMNHIPGEQLKMGPVWDFDISLGNIDYNGNESYEGFWVKDAIWISRFFEDPVFVELVKTRFQYFYSNREEIFGKIISNAAYLNSSQQENYCAWNTLGEIVWPNYVAFDTYEEEVDYLLNWLEHRYEWLNQAIGEL